MLEVHPFFLENIFWENEKVMNIVRADGVNISLYTDASTLIYFLQRILISLIENFNTLTEEEFRNIYGFVHGLYEIIEPILNLQFEDNENELGDQ